MVIVVVFFTTAELALYLAGVQPANVAGDPFVGFSSQTPHFVEQPGADGQTVVVLSPSKRKSFNTAAFRARKERGTYRIFCVGGSTTYGRPFFDATSFPGWLRALLPVAESTRKWEVINAGGISYASYRVAGVMDELSRYAPDLFVVYVGHNEFLERRTYQDILATPGFLRESAALVRRTRLATAVGYTLRQVGIAGPATAVQSTGPTQKVKAIPVDAVGPEAYTRDNRHQDQVVRQFRLSLARMIDTAQRAGAAIVLVTPASNLADFAPFKSAHRKGLTAADMDSWDRGFRHGLEQLKAGDAKGAVESLRRAEAIDDQYAALHYELARGLLQLGADAEARGAFERAREEDICPLRAVAAITDAVRSVAAERGVPLADFDQFLTDHVPRHIPGEESFYDHVHPTIDANRQIALQIIASLASAKIIQTGPDWNQRAIDAVTGRVMGGIDGGRYATELHQLARMLEWLGHHEQARKTALEALQLAGGSADSNYQVGLLYASQGDPATAALYFRKALVLHPKSAAAELQLGIALAALGQLDDATEHIRKTIALQPELADAHSRLGLLLTRQGLLEQAKEQFAIAARLAPNSGPAHSNLGLALANLGQWDKAIAEYQRALILTPNDSAAHLNYAMALESQGNRAAAVDQYRTVLRLKPDHPKARERLQALEPGNHTQTEPTRQ